VFGNEGTKSSDARGITQKKDNDLLNMTKVINQEMLGLYLENKCETLVSNERYNQAYQLYVDL